MIRIWGIFRIPEGLYPLLHLKAEGLLRSILSTLLLLLPIYSILGVQVTICRDVLGGGLNFFCVLRIFAGPHVCSSNKRYRTLYFMSLLLIKLKRERQLLERFLNYCNCVMQ